MDLKFGSRDGADPNFIFGEIGGIQVASDGTIYVLDNRALEVRVFSSEGEYLRTIVRRGEGPGEILRSNGIILSGDTLPWINETRQLAWKLPHEGQEGVFSGTLALAPRPPHECAVPVVSAQRFGPIRGAR